MIISSSSAETFNSITDSHSCTVGRQMIVGFKMVSHRSFCPVAVNRQLTTCVRLCTLSHICRRFRSQNHCACDCGTQWHRRPGLGWGILVFKYETGGTTRTSAEIGQFHASMFSGHSTSFGVFTRQYDTRRYA